jgi:hypothetical protein
MRLPAGCRAPSSEPLWQNGRYRPQSAPTMIAIARIRRLVSVIQW